MLINYLDGMNFEFEIILMSRVYLSGLSINYEEFHHFINDS